MPDTETKRPRVYLNKVHLKGFKSIEDLTIDIQKGLNILIGKNGAGKSNFLDAINQLLIYNYRKRDESRVFFKYSRLEFSSDDNHLFVVEIEREKYLKTDSPDLSDRLALSEKFLIDGKVEFESSKNIEARQTLIFNDKKILYRGVSEGLFFLLGYSSPYPLFIKYDLPNELQCVNLPGTVNVEIEETIFWRFPKTLNFITEIFTHLDLYYWDDPTELAKVTSTDILTRLQIQKNIWENLKHYTPIEDVRFNPNLNIYKDEKSLIIDNVKLDFKINGNWLPWSQLSDGTRRLFYIISEVTFTKGIVLIEEPELGIHPHQFSLLMDFLKEQSEDKQIIISTHSPKALDILSPDELNSILIASYDRGKGTQIKHLTETEKQKAKRYMKEVGFFSDYWLHSDLEE